MLLCLLIRHIWVQVLYNGHTMGHRTQSAHLLNHRLQFHQNSYQQQPNKERGEREREQKERQQCERERERGRNESEYYIKDGNFNINQNPNYSL